MATFLFFFFLNLRRLLLVGIGLLPSYSWVGKPNVTSPTLFHENSAGNAEDNETQTGSLS